MVKQSDTSVSEGKRNFWKAWYPNWAYMKH